MVETVPGSTATTALWDANNPSEPYVIKFVVPLVATIVGFVEFLITAGLLIYACVKTPEVT